MASLMAPTITNIYRVRSDLRLTQAEFAERLGIATSYVSRLENGEYPCSQELLSRMFTEFKILEKYGKNFDWLIQPFDRQYRIS